MDQNLLLAVMAGFVIISAVALCIQAGLLFGIYRATREMQQQSSTLIPQAKNILHLTEATLQESRQHIVDITAKANTMMDTAKVQLAKMDTLTTDVVSNAKAQMAKVDALVTDATVRAKNQMERAEMVVDDTVSRVHESVAAVHNGILVPVRQVNAFAAGVRTAVSVFLRGGRPNVAEATQDTEMFI